MVFTRYAKTSASQCLIKESKELLLLFTLLLAVNIVTVVFDASVNYAPMTQKAQCPGSNSPGMPWIRPTLYTIVIKHNRQNSSNDKHYSVQHEH